MPSRSTRSTVATAFLVGLLVGAAVLPAIGAVDDARSDDEGPDATPAFSYYRSSGGCLENATFDENAGWVHAVASGETYGVTLNATVAHPAGTDVEANVSLRETGVYELALRTVPAEETPRDGRTCTTLTDLGVATGLEYPQFVVTMDGREVLSVDQEETTANLYPLPNPLNAT